MPKTVTRKTKEEKLKEIQPNSQAREEFLIVCEYLQNKAYDEDHAATQAEIIEYAKKKYHINNIRRDRIAQIFIHLEQLSYKNPNLLPFRLEVKELNKTKKYYVPEKMFTEEEIEAILNSLYKYKNLSSEETKRIASKVLKVATNEQNLPTIVSKVRTRRGRTKKIDDEDYRILEDFLESCHSHDRIIFKLKNPADAEYSDKMVRKYRDTYAEDSYGYAYMTYEIGQQTKAIIYDDVHQNAIATDFDNLEIIRNNGNNHSKNLSFPLVHTDALSVEDWAEKHYSGIDGALYTYKLKVTAEYKGNKMFKSRFENFKKDFKTYWNKDLEYELVDREVQIHSFDEQGNPYLKTVVAKDAIFEIKANRSAFNHWYVTKDNFDRVVILEPKALNDILLQPIVERYVRRINKYGAKYNLTLNTEYKPEYIEERDRMYKQFIEQKENRLKKRKEASENKEESKQ